MKRDLEIAREIQSWLMPSKAPEVPGVDIASQRAPLIPSREITTTHSFARTAGCYS
jgi:hypothetical protein